MADERIVRREKAAAHRTCKKHRPEKVLRDYRTVIAALPYMNEEEVEACLIKEVREALPIRSAIVKKLHSRFTKLRQEREIGQYLNGSGGA